MSSFGEVLFNRSRFIFWTLAPSALLGMAAITFPFELDGSARSITILACDLLGLLLIASLWPYHRIPGARRLLMGSVGTMYALYILAAWLPGLMPRPPQGGSPPSIWLASLGFLVVGLPSLTYAFLGRFQITPPPILLDPDEPLLLEAYDRARASLHRLVKGFREAPDATCVRFPFETDEQTIEHLWGVVTAMTATDVTVEVLTQPMEHGEYLGELTIQMSEIEDWEVEYPTGDLEGGFTTRAMCTYAEREGLDVPGYIKKRAQLYRDVA